MGLALVSRSQSSAHLSLPEESLCCLGTWSSLSLNVLTNVKYLPLNGFVCGSVLSVFCLFVSCFFFFSFYIPPSLYLKRKGTELYFTMWLAPHSIARVFPCWKCTTAACTEHTQGNFKSWLRHHRTPQQGWRDLCTWGGCPSPLQSCGCPSWVACLPPEARIAVHG